MALSEAIRTRIAINVGRVDDRVELRSSFGGRDQLLDHLRLHHPHVFSQSLIHRAHEQHMCVVLRWWTWQPSGGRSFGSAPWRTRRSWSRPAHSQRDQLVLVQSNHTRSTTTTLAIVPATRCTRANRRTARADAHQETPSSVRGLVEIHVLLLEKLAARIKVRKLHDAVRERLCLCSCTISTHRWCCRREHHRWRIHWSSSRRHLSFHCPIILSQLLVLLQTVRISARKLHSQFRPTYTLDRPIDILFFVCSLSVI